MKAELVDTLGSDLTVVNAARVSFDKHHELFTNGDEKLIKYLATHGHWTPFGHPQLQLRISAHTSITLHIKAPVFVARQLGKHQIGLVWNEISRRYVDYTPEIYTPEEWRLAADDKKQGSSNQTVEYSVQPAYVFALQCYQNMIESGIAPEQARMVLPQSTYTEWYWTGSLFAFSRVCKLRLHDDAQLETRELAQQINDLIKPKFPISWRYLVEEP